MKALIFSSMFIVLLFLASCIFPTQNSKFKDVKVYNPGQPLNTDGVDYGATISHDGKMIFFISNREGSHKRSGKFSHDFWFGMKKNLNDSAYTIIQNFDPPGINNIGINTELDEGLGGFSFDYSEMYFTACNRWDGLGSCDIICYEIDYTKNKFTILGRQKIGSEVNSKYWESQPSISPDHSFMIFTSNNNNGQPLEYPLLKMSEFDFITQSWKYASIIDADFNKIGDKFTPFICADNKTIIFASRKLKPNYGGFDLYYTVLNEDGSFAEPVNFGPAINTKYDEITPSLSGSGDVLYFSSKREDIENSQGDLDIFYAEIPRLYDEIKTMYWRNKEKGNVSILIQNDAGKTINVINVGEKEAGWHSMEWDGKDSKGNELPPGIYYYTMNINFKYKQPNVLIKKIQGEVIKP